MRKEVRDIVVSIQARDSSITATTATTVVNPVPASAISSSAPVTAISSFTAPAPLESVRKQSLDSLSLASSLSSSAAHDGAINAGSSRLSKLLSRTSTRRALVVGCVLQVNILNLM